MIGRGTGCLALRRRLAEEDLAKVVLEEERVRYAEAGEHPQDVAIEHDRLASPSGCVRTVPEVPLVDDDVLRVTALARLNRAEEREQRAVRPQDPRELVREHLGRGLVHVV